MEVYKPRLKAPSKTEALLFSDKNFFTKYGYGMPNCTPYCWGEWMRRVGRSIGCRGNAGGWIDEVKERNLPWKISQTPVLGAIAVWKIPNTKNDGHVGMVEEIGNRAEANTSNSAYKGTMFFLQTHKASNNYAWTSKITGKRYVLQGFICPPEPFIEQPRPLKITAAVQFREIPTNPRTKVGSVPKGAIFMYNGQYEIVNNVKWLNGEYDGRTAWLSAIFTEEV